MTSPSNCSQDLNNNNCSYLVYRAFTPNSCSNTLRVPMHYQANSSSTSSFWHAAYPAPYRDLSSRRISRVEHIENSREDLTNSIGFSLTTQSVQSIQTISEELLKSSSHIERPASPLTFLVRQNTQLFKLVIHIEYDSVLNQWHGTFPVPDQHLGVIRDKGDHYSAVREALESKMQAVIRLPESSLETILRKYFQAVE